MSLDPCASCRRHVAAHERECPFCGAARTTVSIRATPLAGRLSRAAVFAGLPACWMGNESPQRQTPPQPPPVDEKHVDGEPPGDGAALSGVVTDNGTRMPLANAKVELRDGNGLVAATTTDERGHYEFRSVAPGDYQLVTVLSTYDAGGSTQQPVSVRDVPTLLDVAMPVYRRAPSAKPYGAPPARRRIV